MNDMINHKCRVTEDKLAAILPGWHVEGYIGGGTWSDVYLIRKDVSGIRTYSALKVLRTYVFSTASEERPGADGTAAAGGDGALTYNLKREKVESFSYYSTEKEMSPDPGNLSPEAQMNRIISGIPNTVSAEDIYIENDRDTRFVYLRMEYLPSIQRMMRSVAKNARFEMAERNIRKLGMDISLALSGCGERGILHLGIRPSNLFTDKNGNYKISDFPLTKKDAAARLSQFSSGNEAMFYMAPEIIAGRSFDTRADIYSLGIVMYQILNAGRLPFMPPFPAPCTHLDEDDAYYFRMRGDIFPDIPGAGKDIQDVIRKACAFKPEERYQNCRELYEALRKCKTADGGTEAVPQEKKSSALFISSSLLPSGKEDPMLSGKPAPERDVSRSGQEERNHTVRINPADSGPRDRVRKKQGSLSPVSNVAPVIKQGSLNKLQVPADGNARTEELRTDPDAKTEQLRTDPEAKTEQLRTDPDVKTGESVKVSPVELKDFKGSKDSKGPKDSEEPKEPAKKKSFLWAVPVCLCACAAIVFFILKSGLLTDKAPKHAFPDISTIALDGCDTAILDMGQMESSFSASIEAIEISFQDPVLEESIRNALQLTSEKLTVSDFRGIKELTLEVAGANQEKSISSLNDLMLFPALEKLSMRDCGLKDEIDYSVLEKLPNLQYLDFHHNEISDLSSFGGMAVVSYLDLSKNKITDLSPIRSLTMLESLALYKNSIVDIEPLRELTKLRELYLDDNKIADVSSLQNLSALQILRLDNNEISDLTPLKPLASLYSLNLEDNKVTDITPLGSLTSLTELWAGDNEVEKIDSLKSLSNLLYLNLDGNKITDLAPVKELSKIRELVLSDNKIKDISPIQNMTELTYLDLEKNSVSDISSIGKLTKLDTLYLNRNEIKDLSPLKTLTNLTVLALGRNKIEDVSPLKDLKTMKSLDLYTNQIKDISALGNLTELTWLNAGDNQISDLSAVKGMGKLDTLQVYKNTVADISSLKDLKNLRYLELDRNSIKDIAALAGLSKLERLYIEYNQVTDVSPLKGLTGLKKVYLAGNSISDYSPLDQLTQGTEIYKESQYE